MKQKIQYFPITSFAVIMGLTGLSIVFGKFYHLQWLPRIFYDISIFTVLALFLGFSVLYSLKLAWFPNEVKTDFTHRIRINFFSAISISLLLLSIAYSTYYPMLSVPLWWAGLILHTVFMFKTISFWIQHNFEIQHFNPAWFIPVVGNILIPVSGVDFAPVMVSYFYFTVGFFFWIILFTIFLYRAIFHVQLPEKFIPTFFILLAPPAVGFIAYLRITGSWDSFSVFLLLIAYFFVALLAVMYKSFTRLKFFMSWWAFTFPLAAITIASSVAYQVTQYPFFKFIAWLLLFVAITATSLVAWHTFKYMRKGEICIKED
ncbi:MAG: SLAC1 anion channel family protein [Bacteroidales bacterium]|nr:SLAC1 anion channel family protein [Bacteroidales bacterium]